MLYVCKEINKQKKHSPGKKNKGENKAFKKKQTKRRTFTHVFFQNKSFFFNRNIEMATFFFVCSKHYCFVHTKKAFFALFFGFALLLEQKKNINRRSFLFVCLFFVFCSFFEVGFCQPGFNTTAVFWFQTKTSFQRQKQLERSFRVGKQEKQGFFFSSEHKSKQNKFLFLSDKVIICFEMVTTNHLSHHVIFYFSDSEYLPPNKNDCVILKCSLRKKQ